MYTNESLYEKIYELLRANGMGALAKIAAMKLEDYYTDIRLGDSVSDNQILQRLTPLYAAVHLGFSSDELFTVMSAFSLDPKCIAMGMMTYSLHAMETPIEYRSEQGEAKLDTVTFLSRVASAWLKGRNVSTARDDLMPWLLGESEYALALMNQHTPELTYRHLLDELRFATRVNRMRDTYLYNRVSGYSVKALTGKIADVCCQVQDISLCPDASISTLLSCTGALHDLILRKRFNNAQVWERVLRESLDIEFQDELLSHALSPGASTSLTQAKQLLLSLDFEIGQNEEPFEFFKSVAMTLESLVKRLQGTNLEPLLSEEAFLIGFFTHLMVPEPVEGFDLTRPDDVEDCLGKADLAKKFCRLLTNNPHTLVSRLMASQMHDESIPASGNQYLLWSRLGNATLAPQQIDPEVASRYLQRMAQDFQTLKVPGVSTLEHSVQMYQSLNESMRHLCKQLAPLIDYSSLRLLPEQQRSELALWGLDVAKLGITSEAVIDHRFAVDLGL